MNNMKEPRERKATKRINEIYYDLKRVLGGAGMGSPALDSLALEILAIKHYLDELEGQTLKIDRRAAHDRRRATDRPLTRIS
ncbi:MAG: hypothetical protein WA383_17600 [Terriglobales bacterium]